MSVHCGKLRWSGVLGALGSLAVYGVAPPWAHADQEETPSLLIAPPQRVLGVPEYLELVLRQTSEIWANPIGGARRTTVYTGLLEFGAEFDLGGAGWLPGASVGAFGLFIQGVDVSAQGVGDAGVVSNVAGQATLRFFSAWYEHRWLDDRIRLKVGVIPLDDDFMIVDSAMLFVNSGFGLIQTLALSVPSPVYPLGAFGLRVHVQSSEAWTFQVGVYDGDAGDESDDRYASDLGWSHQQGATLVAEASWSPAFARGRIAGGGAVHFGLVPNYAKSEDERGIGILYMMFERRLTDAFPSELVVFAHGSVAVPGRRALAVAYVDVGAVWGGGGWSRPADRIGLGLAWTRFGAPYVENLRRNAQFVTASEWVGELTYELWLLPWLRIQPTVQWIGKAHFAARNALALGLRASVNL